MFKNIYKYKIRYTKNKYKINKLNIYKISKNTY